MTRRELIDANPCPECDSGNLVAEPVVTRYWRGWVVECPDCGTVTEYDEPETPADHREVAR